MKKLRKAVFPVAGLGTRFLPATKAMPKEMLTIVDRPLIQYAVEEALEAGIEQIRPGNRIGDVSNAVEQRADAAGLSVVREYVGHGVGRALHEDPQVPNYGPPARGPELRSGLVIAVEPMVNMGGWETAVLADEWTVVTLDGSLSAHFEHTIAVTEDGHEVLTARD
jgi:methionyl aminopeptidase